MVQSILEDIDPNSFAGQTVLGPCKALSELEKNSEAAWACLGYYVHAESCMICPQQNLLSLPLPLLNSDLDLNKWIQHTNPMPYSYIIRPHSMLPVVVLSPMKPWCFRCFRCNMENVEMLSSLRRGEVFHVPRGGSRSAVLWHQGHHDCICPIFPAQPSSWDMLGSPM